MRFGSLFTGVGGFDLGLERAGMTCVFQCEADPYRRRVLARHWPGVPCFEDVRAVGIQLADGHGSVGAEHGQHRDDSQTGTSGLDLLCGGFPCQDLSVAGRRKGLAGERSGLFFEFARIADELVRPGGYVLIENVPGLLSSADGRDFAIVLATLAELGFHDLAWRVLDSRYFGVPQRRRRVFILGRRASGRVCAEVLLESEGGQGDSQARGEAREGVAGSVADGATTARTLTASDRYDGDTEDFIAVDSRSGAPVTEAPTLDKGAEDGPRREQGGLLIPARLDGPSLDPDGVRTPPRLPRRVDDPARASAEVDAFSVAENQRGEVLETPYAKQLTTGGGKPGQGYPMVRVAAPLTKGSAATPGVSYPGRRKEDDENLALAHEGTPTLAVPYDPKPDGPRYAAMGDAVTVNVLEWIGRRLLAHPENATQSRERQ